MASSPGWKRLTGLAEIAAGRHCEATPRTVEVEVWVEVVVVITVTIYQEDEVGRIVSH